MSSNHGSSETVEPTNKIEEPNIFHLLLVLGFWVIITIIVVFALNNSTISEMLGKSALGGVIFATFLLVVFSSIIVLPLSVFVDRLIFHGKDGGKISDKSYILADTGVLGLTGLVIGAFTGTFFIGIPFNIKHLPGLIAFIALSFGAATYLYPHLQNCDGITDGIDQVNCYTGMAIASNDFTVCDKIKSNSQEFTSNLMKAMCYGEFQARNGVELCNKFFSNAEKGLCYGQMAYSKNDRAICDQLGWYEGNSVCKNYFDS